MRVLTSIGQSVTNFIKKTKPEYPQIIKKIDLPDTDSIELSKLNSHDKEAVKVLKWLDKEGNKILKTLTGCIVEVRGDSNLLSRTPNLTFTFKPGENYKAAVQNFIAEHFRQGYSHSQNAGIWNFIDESGNLKCNWYSYLSGGFGFPVEEKLSDVKKALKELAKNFGKI